MSDLKRCDECGKETAPVDASMHWMELRRESSLTWGEVASHDFCSWACLATYAGKRAAVVAQAPTVTVTCDGEPCPPHGYSRFRSLKDAYQSVYGQKYRGVV